MLVARRATLPLVPGAREFHATSSNSEKHRSLPKRSFFKPRHRYWANVESLHENGYESSYFGEVLKYMRHFSHPLASKHVRRIVPELVFPSDFLKKVYYRRYPRERYQFVHRNAPGSNEWYRLPVERFIDRAEKYQREGATVGGSIAKAFRDRTLEKQALRIEYEVSQQQSEILFGIEETDWVSLAEQGNPTTDIMEHDPRGAEALLRDSDKHVKNLITQRESDPTLPLLKHIDIGMKWIDIMNWIQAHPETRKHFDESIYFEDESAFDLHLPASLRKDQKRPPPGENTMLDDLNFQMSKWAGNMIEAFHSEVNIEDVPEEEKEKAFKLKFFGNMKRNLDVSFIEEMTDDFLEADHALSPASYMRPLPRSSAEEVLEASEPAIHGDLRQEMDELFADLHSKRSSSKK